MHVRLGGYHAGDIEFSAAFDVNAGKVGRDLAEAIFAEPNNTYRFASPAATGVRFCRIRRSWSCGAWCQERR